MTVCNRHKWDHDAPCIYCERQDAYKQTDEYKRRVESELKEEEHGYR
ncbi:hypothetical protein L3i20_v245620 [Paenibacillus sp. L3-i20]|nr:hypothetical protein L3i20_v245620 [Paenibacillus sp. L3-i20]